MHTVFSPDHARHAGNVELTATGLVPAFEKPERAEIIRARVEAVKLGPVLPPAAQDLGVARRIHAPDFVDFLPRVWPMWAAAGRSGTAMPFTWPTRGLRGDVPPEHIDGLLGYYSFDAGANFVEGTWEAIRSSYAVALTGADLVAGGARAAFALCRPPGHHAGRAFMGGYCYINNAACAVQRLIDRGAGRVSVLDIDYHHGNGTQEIFWTRGDVQVVNLHADPMQEYPYFLGHADERGAGPGEGTTLNLPMRWGTAWDRFGPVLDEGCRAIAAWGPDAVVVSLGVDTFERDPISKFRLKSEDYPRIGARIAALGRPALFVMEGGYAVAEVGLNAVGVLTGFEGG
jgi:acetoin utilization deacetylase AcuC-like enzyme